MFSFLTPHIGKILKHKLLQHQAVIRHAATRTAGATFFSRNSRDFDVIIKSSAHIVSQ